MDLETAQTTTTTKLPILKQGECDMWRLRIGNTFNAKDYDLWPCHREWKLIQTSSSNNKQMHDGTQSLLIPRSLSIGPVTQLDMTKSKRWKTTLEGLVNVEEISSQAMVAIVASGFDWEPNRGGLFSPLKFDLSNSGLEEFQQPEFEGYGPKPSKSFSEDTSNEVRKSPDAPLVEECWCQMIS
ncbi:hypothetical protein Tco_0004272 [Tanacetum coccineum]